MIPPLCRKWIKIEWIPMVCKYIGRQTESSKTYIGKIKLAL